MKGIIRRIECGTTTYRDARAVVAALIAVAVAALVIGLLLGVAL